MLLEKVWKALSEELYIYSVDDVGIQNPLRTCFRID